MEINPLNIILINSDSKGDRLLFRYPFNSALSTSKPEVSKIKRKNPYALSSSLCEDLLQSNNEISNNQFGQLTDEVLSTLFAVKLELANQKFELKVNEIRFVSHPAVLQNKNSDTYILINIVFAISAQCSYSIVKCYYELSKKLSIAILHEEERANYLTKEIKLMLKAHDDASIRENTHKLDSTAVFEKILRQSPLAQCMKNLYSDLCTTGLINLTINESVTLCFCLPQKAHKFHKKGSFVEPEVIDKCLQALKPYHGMLLLVDPSELFDCIPPSGARILLQLIEIYNPLKSLQSLATDSNLSLDQVYQLVGHLVYWAKATIIYPLCETNVYVIAPDAPLHIHSSLVEKFSTKFPGMSLFEVISDFSLPTSIGHLTTPLQMPARQGRLAQMVLWMLQHHLLLQLHTYVQFMPAKGNQAKRNAEKNGFLENNGVFTENEDALPELAAISSNPVPLPSSSIKETKEPNSESYQYPSSSQKSFHSTASECEEDKIKDLLMVFDECDREAIMKVPASSNYEDLSLMVRLYQSGYFKGEHHLEEIMYFENLRRSHLLQLLDKFRDVLIIYETEDFNFWNFFAS